MRLTTRKDAGKATQRWESRWLRLMGPSLAMSRHYADGDVRVVVRKRGEAWSWQVEDEHQQPVDSGGTSSTLREAERSGFLAAARALARLRAEEG
jgi:hypothetical protein